MKQKKCKTKQQEQALRRNSGQAMILTVLVLSSTVLSLSAIGGYLMLIRLRTSSDVVNTTKAIYAADAGLECAALSHFRRSDGLDCGEAPYDSFVDVDASYTTKYVEGPPSYIQSNGNFRNSNRAFRMDF